MDVLPLAFRALVIGFAIAAVIGPMGLLCIERTLRSGLAAGLATGLGVALADGLYALLVGLGVVPARGQCVDHVLRPVLVAESSGSTTTR